MDEPHSDFTARGVLDPAVLPHYHYRDDCLALHHTISSYTNDLLRVFYKTDEDVRGDAELQLWMQTLTANDGGRVRGLPLTDGRLMTVEDLVKVVAQIIFSVSVEHAAVNNGQYNQFGWIPNTPGAMYLPPPEDHGPRSEKNFVYALPDAYAVGQQLALVHLLSQRTLTPLGMYPDNFFRGNMPVRAVLDRFRADLDDAGRTILARNAQLAVPYQYLEPWRIGRSIAI